MAINDSFWRNEKSRLLAILQPRLTQMAVDAAKQAAQKAGIGFNPALANAHAARWARDYTDALLDQLGTTSAKGVGEIIGAWVETPGATYGELQKSLMEYGAVRAQAIAVTETTRAYSEGEQQAYLNEGITHWVWRTNNDELVCRYCGSANNQVRKIGESFGDFRGKAVTKPPYHPGCRCWVSPKVSPNAERDAVVKPVNPPPMPEMQSKTITDKTTQSLAQRFKDKLPKDNNLKVSVRSALQSIDKVLSIPKEKLPGIPIEETSDRVRLGGTVINTNTNQVVRFSISKKGDHPELTMAHEFGHYIDREGIGTPGGWSSKLDEIPGWREAITNSQAYKDLQKLKQIGNVDVNGNIVKIDKEHVNYLLSDHELFARSFSQYIATKSGDTMMLKQVVVIRSRSAENYSARQWNDADFAPISKMYDDYFKSIGWLP